LPCHLSPDRPCYGGLGLFALQTYFIVFVIFALYAPDFLLGIAARKTFRYNDPRQTEPEGNP